ncbi:MAG: penicillin-binding protein, partial [Bacteroidales bacterium]|nr:penicillin-binding protein [Bacteroidales bacterium]
MTEKTEKTIIRLFWIILTLPFALVLFAVLLVWIFAEIPSFKELEHPDSKMATQILADGGELLTTFHIENRTFVDYEDISPNVVHAAVATEDSRFYQHSGIDFRGLGRVAFKTLLLGDRNQGGGSTITQQLAKTLYPRKETGGKLGMVIIKLKEWITAVKIERNYTKDEIMDMYLNSIFFGSGAYGIQTAAETFFAKKPKDLTVEEAATLIGMINKPTRYSPVLNPDKSLSRRNFVLGQMEKAGYLNSQQRDSISRIPIKIPDFRVADHNAGIALYLRDMLRRDMNARKPRRSDYKQIDDYRVDSLRWEEDALYGWLNKTKKANGTSYNIDRDGLKIYTTINYKMQKYAEEAVAEHLGGYLQSAFWRDLKYRSHPPFSNGVSEKTRDLLMNQARRWSDRYMTMKEEGAREKDILST